MKPKTIASTILGICLILMAVSLWAYRSSHPSAASAELIASNSCSVCAPPSTNQKCIGCGISLADEGASYDASYQGKTYRFCCKECATAFEKDPAAFMAKHPALQQ